MIFLLLVKYFFLLCYKKFSFEFGLYGEQKFKWIKFCGKIFFCIRMNRYKRETWNETVLHSFIFFDKKAKQKFCLFDFLKRKILLLFDFIGSFFFLSSLFFEIAAVGGSVTVLPTAAAHVMLFGNKSGFFFVTTLLTLYDFLCFVDLLALLLLIPLKKFFAE